MNRTAIMQSQAKNNCDFYITTVMYRLSMELVFFGQFFFLKNVFFWDKKTVPEWADRQGGCSLMKYILTLSIFLQIRRQLLVVFVAESLHRNSPAHMNLVKWFKKSAKKENFRSKFC